MNNVTKFARYTGLLYTLQIPLAAFGIMWVSQGIVVEGDAAATMHNILANESLFRWSMAASLATQVFHIFIALMLYRLLKPVNRMQAYTMALLLIISVPVTMFNELNHFAMLLFAQGSPLLAGFSSEQLGALVMQFNDLHEFGIQIVSVFWGLWLVPMGLLIIKSNFLPKLLGYAALLVAVGYVLDAIMFVALPDAFFGLAGFVGFAELLIPLWLLLRSVQQDKWEQWATGPVAALS